MAGKKIGLGIWTGSVSRAHSPLHTLLPRIGISLVLVVLDRIERAWVVEWCGEWEMPHAESRAPRAAKCILTGKYLSMSRPAGMEMEAGRAMLQFSIYNYYDIMSDT
jgi:hypothetical protein